MDGWMDELLSASSFGFDTNLITGKSTNSVNGTDAT